MNTIEAMPERLVPLSGENSRPPYFLVGRNNRGQWVVCDQYARNASLFRNRAEALRFAFRERGETAGAVVLVPDKLHGAAIDAATAPDDSTDEFKSAAPRIRQEV